MSNSEAYSAVGRLSQCGWFIYVLIDLPYRWGWYYYFVTYSLCSRFRSDLGLLGLVLSIKDCIWIILNPFSVVRKSVNTCTDQ